jgi:phosphohistidine phosphatase
MKIYLIRHGDAEQGSFSKRDFDRELTSAGIEKLEKTAEGWKRFIKGFDLIVTSPYVRALKTARIIAQAYGLPEDKLITDDRLGCGCRTDDIINIANSLGAEKIAFVGHEPDISNHISNLVSGCEVNVEFKKGMIAKIAFGSRARFSRGALQYLIPCEAFI